MKLPKSKITQTTVAERVRWVFGDVAETILKTEEKRIGAPLDKLSAEDAQVLAEDLKELSLRMAGPELANRVYQEVIAAISKNKNPKP